MKPQTAVVLGATGLIGSQLVQLLLADDAFERVRLLVRRPVHIVNNKLSAEIIDFNNIVDYRNKLGSGDSIFCCVGTTQGKVKGDRQAYRKVDYDIAVNAAKLGVESGFSKYLLVSSIGANENSKNFYLSLKGEVENAISKFPYKSISIFQPSLLLGARSEARLGERLAKGFMKTFSFAFAGSISKYKGIEAKDVARAMVAASKQGVAGVTRYRYNEMMQLIKQDQHQV